MNNNIKAGATQLINPATGSTAVSDLRQHGWRIVRAAVTL